MSAETRAFTASGNGILSTLVVPVDVFPAFDPQIEPVPQAHRFNAIWDTGATNTCISSRVAQACNLRQLGWASSHTANGVRRCKTYLVNIKLITGAGFVGITVSEAPITGGDLLIGMDIITRGDFVVTNHNGKTVFTFRTPSRQTVDFTTNPDGRFTETKQSSGTPSLAPPSDKSKRKRRQKRQNQRTSRRKNRK